VGAGSISLGLEQLARPENAIWENWQSSMKKYVTSAKNSIIGYPTNWYGSMARLSWKTYR